MSTHKIMIVGDSCVGKTSLIAKSTGSPTINQYSPTIGVEFTTKTLLISGELVRLQLWDTSGRNEFRSITTSFFRGVDGAFIAYDITDRASYLSISNWITDVTEHNPDCKIMLVGCKSDLEENRRITTQEAMIYAQQNGWLFAEVSHCEKHDQMFQCLLCAILNIDESVQIRSIDKPSYLEKVKRKCCAIM